MIYLQALWIMSTARPMDLAPQLRWARTCVFQVSHRNGKQIASWRIENKRQKATISRKNYSQFCLLWKWLPAVFFSILQLAICLPFRWLTRKTNVLAHRKWGRSSMGRAVNIIHSACKDIIDNVTLVHNDLYMLHIFDELHDELPEFKAFLEYEFEKKSHPMLRRARRRQFH